MWFCERLSSTLAVVFYSLHPTIMSFLLLPLFARIFFCPCSRFRPFYRHIISDCCLLDFFFFGDVCTLRYSCWNLILITQYLKWILKKLVTVLPSCMSWSMHPMEGLLDYLEDKSATQVTLAKFLFHWFTGWYCATTRWLSTRSLSDVYPQLWTSTRNLTEYSS